MSDRRSTKTLVTGKDGRRYCPKCPESFETMDAWMTHVSDNHDPIGEFIARWTNLEEDEIYGDDEG